MLQLCKKKSLLVILGLGIMIMPFSKIASAQTSIDASQVERLASVAELWGSTKYFHPYVAQQNIDWDSALVAVLPEILAADDSASFRHSIERLMGSLEDPATRVQKISAAEKSEGEPASIFSWKADSILVATLNANTIDYFDYRKSMGLIGQLKSEIEKANGVVFDLRATSNAGVVGYYWDLSQFASTLTSRSLRSPSQRSRMHMGFKPESGSTSGGYYSAFQVREGEAYLSQGDRAEIPIVFLINETGELPSLAVSLQQAGLAIIVSEGESSGSSSVQTHVVETSDNIQVQIRLSESINPNGSVGFAADHTVAHSIDETGKDEALAYALALATNFTLPTTNKVKEKPRGNLGPVERSDVMGYPSKEHRILAAFKIWSVIEYFFPYKDLMDEDWGDVFRQSLPDIVEAEDALAFHLAIASFYAQIDDSHGYINSPQVRNHLGAASDPLYIRWVENLPVVVGFKDSTAAVEAGVEIGDVVLNIDGVSVKERVDLISKYTAASTPQALNGRIASSLLFGPEGSSVTVGLESAGGQQKEVQLIRKGVYNQGFTYRSGDVVKILEGNIGYVDLDRLASSQVPEIFERFKNTKAIIFDMRGYPNGTAWTIAPYLADAPEKDAALFECPLVMGPSQLGRQKNTFIQKIPPPTPMVSQYKGETIMLIDDRTVSQAEHTGLFFESANGTKFIGSHTTGANGDVTNFQVPGGIRLAFTGQAVRHADGRQLQRIGLVPHLESKPTVEGIRNGIDEVLETALEFLKEN